MAGAKASTGIQTDMYFSTTQTSSFASPIATTDFVGSTKTGKPTNKVDGVTTVGAFEQSANTINVGVLGETSQRSYPAQTTPSEFTFEIVLDYSKASHIALDGLGIGDTGEVVFDTQTKSTGEQTVDYAKVALAGKSKQISPDDATRLSFTFTLPDGSFKSVNAA